jgi:ketosteroid isomerase-like protein
MRSDFADDFTWHQRAEWPGRAVYTVDDLPTLWEELDEVYPEFELKAVEYFEAGDAVVVEVHTSARPSSSDERVEGVIWHVWQLTDGVLKNAHVYTERSDALVAARG